MYDKRNDRRSRDNSKNYSGNNSKGNQTGGSASRNNSGNGFGRNGKRDQANAEPHISLAMGKLQPAVIVKKVDFGVYVTSEKNTKGRFAIDEEDKVLLPAKQVPEGAEVGDFIDVFVYRDSSDRPIATTNIPRIKLGETAVLTVKEIGRIGAFLDWGLEKDLFLPYKEMTDKVEAGDEVLVRMYTDKSGRLCASMKGLYHLLRTDSPYKAGDEVEGRIYEFGHDFGTYVAVDDKYSAMIPRHEDTSHLKIGDIIDATVTAIKDDGKIDLTIRQKAYAQMDDDAEKIMELIDSYAGVLPFTEKADPEVIKRETGLSKAAFKRAIGRLYKERRIDLSDGRIRRV